MASNTVNDQPKAQALEKHSKNFYQQFAVFGLVLLLAFSLIYGLGQIVFEKKSHRSLVNELQSKTFGNRWVAAFELSKVLASNTVSQEELVWVTENLIQIYNAGADLRTKEFIVVALGAISNDKSLDFLSEATSSNEGNIAFNAIGALAKMDLTPDLKLKIAERLKEHLKSTDLGLIQVSLLFLTHNPVKELGIEFDSLIKNDNLLVALTTKIAASRFGHAEKLSYLKEILNLKYDESIASLLSVEQIFGLKYNALLVIEKENIKELAPFLLEAEKVEPDLKIVSKLKDVLIQLKN